jgi:hypothetical protein
MASNMMVSLALGSARIELKSRGEIVREFRRSAYGTDVLFCSDFRNFTGELCPDAA